MLYNPKTTISGYVTLALIVCYVAYGFYTGKPLDLQTVLGLLGGGSLAVSAINSKDGGH